MLLGGNSAIGIYMTYGLATLFSCMFFDKKFTLRITIISYFFLVISLYLRSLNVKQTLTAVGFFSCVGLQALQVPIYYILLPSAKFLLA